LLLRTALQHPRIKPLVFALSLLPLVWLVWGAANNALGANPAEYLIRASGDWTLRFLCLTLAVTPVRQLFQLHALARLRRLCFFTPCCMRCVTPGWTWALNGWM
jgi:sulfoxide reductase heme-binding subunit YedZ